MSWDMRILTHAFCSGCMQATDVEFTRVHNRTNLRAIGVTKLRSYHELLLVNN